MVATSIVSYSFGQAAGDLAQIAPIVAVSVALLVAIVVDLILPRAQRGPAVAGVAGLGFLAALILSIALWTGGGTAYSRFATGDEFARFFEALFAVLGLLTVGVAHPYLARRALPQAEFHILILASVAGMMVVGAATSLVSVFLGLELLSISLYIACGFDRQATSSQEAAVKYLMVGGFASAFVLYGMALVYGATGSTLISEIAREATRGNNPLLVMGVTLLGIGFAFKVSGAPFHQWTPDVYQGAPLPVTAFMSVGTKAAAIAMIVRVFNSGLPHISPQWQALLLFVAVASLVVGNLLAIVQTSVKRLLAYSSISQAGYILIGVLAGGRDGLAAVLFYLAAYMFMNFGAFAILITLSGPDGDLDRMSDLEGLGRRHPVLGGLMILFMLSLAGFPPTAGFIGKFFLFTAGVAHGYTLLVIVAVLASVVSVYYYVRVLVHFLGLKQPEAVTAVPLPATLVLGLTGFFSLLLGLLPGALLALGVTGAAPVIASP